MWSKGNNNYNNIIIIMYGLINSSYNLPPVLGIYIQLTLTRMRAARVTVVQKECGLFGFHLRKSRGK